jgi:hypothetical protein
VVLHYYPHSCGESRLLVSWCIGERCDMTSNDDDIGKSRRPGAKDRRWLSIRWVLDGRMIRRSGDTIYGLYHAQGDEEWVFLGFLG